MQLMAQLPGNELHEVGVESDASISVEDAAVLGGDEVRGHDLLVGVHDKALHRTISRLLHRLLDVIQCSLHITLLRTADINHCSRHTHSDLYSLSDFQYTTDYYTPCNQCLQLSQGDRSDQQRTHQARARGTPFLSACCSKHIVN